MSDQQGKPKAAAGWYAHPSQQAMSRYWDGQRWTDQLRPAAPGQVPPPSSQPSVAKVAVWAKAHPRVAIGIVVVLLVVIVGGVFGSEEDDPDDQASDGNDSAQIDAAAKSDKPTADGSKPDEAAADDTECVKLRRASLRQFGSGLRRAHSGAEVTAGFTAAADGAPLDDIINVDHVAAVRVEEAGETAAVVLAVGGPQGHDGLVLGVGEAENWFTWGVDVKSDSPAGRARDAVVNSGATQAALGCLEAVR